MSIVLSYLLHRAMACPSPPSDSMRNRPDMSKEGRLVVFFSKILLPHPTAHYFHMCTVTAFVILQWVANVLLMDDVADFTPIPLRSNIITPPEVKFSADLQAGTAASTRSLDNVYLLYKPFPSLFGGLPYNFFSFFCHFFPIFFSLSLSENVAATVAQGAGPAAQWPRTARHRPAQPHEQACRGSVACSGRE